MAGRARITFSQPGVQPPVFVVTSLSNPPWETLELQVDSKKGTPDHLIFTREFENIAEGNYQYKIRIGHERWVVDETQESTTDESGNRNNVVHVREDTESATSAAPVSTKIEKQESPQQDEIPSQSEPQTSHIPALEPIEPPPSAEEKLHTDSGQTRSDQTPSVPVPFTVVERVPDEPRPEYGDTDAGSLHEIKSNRSADAEPDFETVQPSAPAEPEEQKPALPVPTLIVEKTDDVPSFGDDFGEHATSAQKVAHEKRGADATPDEVVVSPDLSKPVDSPQEDDIDDGGPSPLDEEFAPLFKHESFKPSPTEASNKGMDPIEEEESETSATRTTQDSSEELIPAAEEDEQPAESNRTTQDSSEELTSAVEEDEQPDQNDEDVSELDHAPLFRHESNPQYNVRSELDSRPLLSHETGLSDYNNSNDASEEITEDDVDEEELVDYDPQDEEYDDIEDRTFESERAPTFPHETMNGNDHESEAPLLPHERDSLTPISSNESGILDNDPVLNGEYSFAHEQATPVSGSDTSPSYFAERTRTQSGSLPHIIPRSDEDDEDLHDPSLEAFPTNRDAILARMSTISSSLPEDEVEDRDHLNSPGYTAPSQAASSVSLLPRSGSLLSVAEDEELDEVSDTGSHKELPSPVLDMAPVVKGQQEPPSSELLADKPSGSAKENSEETSSVKASEPTKTSTGPSKKTDPNPAVTRSTESSEASTAESVQKNDGANDSSRKPEVATPATILRPLSPPLTPDNADSVTAQKGDSNAQPEDAATVTPAKSSPDTKSSSSDASIAKPAATDDDSPKQNFFLRFLSSCFGGPKQASQAIFVVAVAAAAYYYLYVLPGAT